MKANEPDYSQFQSIEHINAHIALNGFISALEQKGQDDLSWIKEATVREHLELEQAAILQQAREFSKTWEERRKECGRVPAFPGAFFARQAPQFDDFTEKAILLLQNYGSYIQGEMLATCELFIDALKEEQTTVKELLRQISTLEAKAGESEALRGQVKALEKACKEMENRIQDHQTLIKMFQEKNRAPRQKLTQAEAAACCDVTEKTIRNWDSGATKAPYWYPGRDVTAVEMKMRAQHGKQQDRMAKAARKEIKNSRQYREEED